jgi:diguanylate cyclase (GGDEF)-like protein
VLTIDRFGGACFDDREFETAQLFANLAAIAIQNARSYKEMEQQAINDGLTGIHNHRHFRESLSSTISRAERYGESFCLLMIDLDHFKVVNDTVGHQQGDAVLRAVAAALRDCSRESDYLARYGGEEFVMILPHTELIEARNMAERICEAVRKIDPGVPGLQMSTSVGVASFPESSHDADGVLGAADAALLRAKASGRNRVCMHADEVLAQTLLDGHVVSLGRRFAAHAGLSEDETAALITALSVHELSASSGIITRMGPGGWRDDAAIVEGAGDELETETSDAQRRLAYDALLYANERWDGGGYPEGLRGENIPRVARAFAVCRSYVTGSDQANGGLSRVRAKASSELDPRLVQRLSALVREEAGESGIARNQARIA